MMEFANKLVERVGKGYLSYSSCKEALKDIKLWEMYMQGRLRKDSDALRFGSIYDKLLFEPQLFADEFVIMNDDGIVAEIGGKSPRATKKYKDWLKERTIQATTDGKVVVNDNDYKKALEMIERLDRTPVRKEFLSGDYQVEFNKFIEGIQGDDIPVRGFLDCKGDGYISDSKTTQRMSGFKYDVFKFGYDIQAYIYCKVFDVDEYYWVVQEKAFPYAVGVYKASPQTLESGERKFNTAVEKIKEYLDGNLIPDAYYNYQEI